MVFRWREVSNDVQHQDSSKVGNKNPSAKDARRIEDYQSTGNKMANQMVRFSLTIQNHSYVNGLELFLSQIDGIASVKGDGKYINLEVMGKVDPHKIREMVEHETKKKVDLHFPLAEIQGGGDEKKDTKTKVKKRIMPINENDAVKEKTEENIIVLKVKPCCDSCNQKLEKILKIKGLEMLTKDVDKDLITVRGAVDVMELRSYFKDILKKDVEVVNTVAVLPAKTDDGATYKKDEGEHGGTKPKSTMVVLKMRLHCDGCSEKIKKIISKIKGVEKVSMKVDQNLIQVKGTMDVKELTSALKEKIKSNIEVAPTKMEIDKEDKYNNRNG